MEIDTFARHGLGMIAVVGNDAGWTQIERDQVVILGDDVACRLAYTEYDQVSRGFGGEGVLVKQPEQLEGAFAEALRLSRAGKPVVVNCFLGRSDFRKGSISI